MTVIIAAETLVLALLALLVVGLLRSHGEILRRLDARTGRQGQTIDPSIPQPPDREIGGTALDLRGVSLSGNAIKLAFPEGGSNTILAFLSSGCDICHDFWAAFAGDGRDQLPRGTELIILTKDANFESPSKLVELAPPDVPVVMSTEAWDDYEVPVAPYFVYIDGASGGIQGEGAARSWGQLTSLFADFLLERKEDVPQTETAGGHQARAARVDAELGGAGVAETDPSLYDTPQLPKDQPDLSLEIVDRP